MCQVCRNELEGETELDCCKNVTTIPSLPELEYLYCYNTGITVLPDFPKLVELDCSDTGITILPYLPKVESLQCQRTRLQSLPKLPKVEYIDCFDTFITTLPELPKLNSIYCNRFVNHPQNKNLKTNIEKVVTVQRWWRRFLHNRKYYNLYCQVLGVPVWS